MLLNPERSSHLFPKIFDLQRFQGSSDKLMYFRENIFLPIFKQLILLNLRRLTAQKILTLESRMSLKSFLLNLIFRVDFLQSKRNLILLNFFIILVIMNISPKNMQFFMLIVNQFDDKFLALLLIN